MSYVQDDFLWGGFTDYFGTPAESDVPKAFLTTLYDSAHFSVIDSVTSWTTNKRNRCTSKKNILYGKFLSEDCKKYISIFATISWQVKDFSQGNLIISVGSKQGEFKKKNCYIKSWHIIYLNRK